MNSEISRSRDTKSIEKDLRTLDKFVRVYCEAHHVTEKGALCEDCAALLGYSTARLRGCPHNPKPKCRDCETHCYKPSYREKIKQVMRFSGMYFVKRGRIDWMIKYFI